MIAIIHAELHPVTAPMIEDGTILIEAGKIRDIGADLAIPAGAEVIDAKGAMVTPGFIDVHTHLGIEEEIHPAGEDTNEMTDPVTAQLRAIDGINGRDIGFSDAWQAGITTVMVTMGSANVIGGLTAVLKTAAKTYQDMFIVAEAGLKMAFGENPKRVYGEQKRTPSTRMATMALARQAFLDAQNYEKEGKKDGPNLAHEHLLKALHREIPVRLHAHRADDIMSAIRLRDEFGLDMVIEHATEGHLIVDELVAAQIPCAVGPSLSNRAKVEMEHVTFATAGILSAAGVTVGLITDHPCTPIAYLPTCAGLAIKAGMSQEAALAAVTINSAKILRLDDRLGSLTPGKDADLVIWSGDPFALSGRPHLVMIDGCIL